MRDFLKLSFRYSVLLFLLSCSLSVKGQQRDPDFTRIRGFVVDASTGVALPFVNITFEGTTVGTTSDLNGRFLLETKKPPNNRLKASYVGYETKVKIIKLGKIQRINFRLRSEHVELKEVVVKAKRLRYRNKNNPAVDIIRKVIENKKNNRKEDLDFYEYDKYEKIEFDLNNITDKFKQRKYMKNFQMVFDYLDSSVVMQKNFLPIFLRETVSKVYYRKNPQSYKEFRRGHKMTGFDEYLDDQGISFLLDKMYQDIDIYDNNINILTTQFVSPISVLATITYKYYISDTVEIAGAEYTKLSFQPRNENALAFVGNLYVSRDSLYRVKQVQMTLSKQVNLNFVLGMIIEQEFDFFDNEAYMLTRDHVTFDFNLTKKGMGVFGKRTVSYKDYSFNQPKDDEFYGGVTKIIEEEGTKDRSEEFWEENRHEKLNDTEVGIYEMVDVVKELPAYKRTMNLLLFVMAGYKGFGPVDIGPVNTFYSFNDVEGFRMRFGGRTNLKFSKNYQIEAYGAYGFKDEQFKYSVVGTYFLTEKPLHALRFTRQKEINNPGEELQFVMEDNFLLSFKRGINDKMIYNNKWIAEYIRESRKAFSFGVGLKTQDQIPGGILSFSQNPSEIIFGIKEDEKITTTEVMLNFRYAPNEQYFQGKRFRVPLINKYPIFTLKYAQSFEGVLNSDFSFQKLTFGFFKRFYLSPFGYTDVEVEAAKIWGELPYPLLNIPRANQTFSYQLRSYNLMNFVEFVSDRYVSLNYAHYFNGYILNKIPLIKKLKWRSVVTFKGILGDVSDKNDPSINPNQVPFPVNADGTQATFPLTRTPYIEVSAGIANILKFFRVDVVKRLTFLDRAEVPKGVSLRLRFKVEF